MIIALAKFGITSAKEAKTLEKRWASHRKRNGLDLHGRLGVEKAPVGPCGH
jgi:hypothetical protein